MRENKKADLCHNKYIFVFAVRHKNNTETACINKKTVIIPPALMNRITYFSAIQNFTVKK